MVTACGVDVPCPLTMQQSLSVVHGLREIRLLEHLERAFAAGLDEHLGWVVVAVDLDDIAGKTDHPLDEVLRRVGWRDEDHDVAALRILPKSYEILLASRRSWFCSVPTMLSPSTRTVCSAKAIAT